MKLSIKNQIYLITVSILTVAVIAFSSLTIYLIIKQGNKELADYRTSEKEKIRSSLKEYIDMAYQSVESSYNSIEDKSYLEKYYGHRLQSIIDIAIAAIERRATLVKDKKMSLREAQQLAIKDIEAMRFDDKTGYVWINDTLLPYPTMIMHPTVPGLNGKILDDSKFNCAMGKNQNLFQAGVEVCNMNGKGFINYIWPKPSLNGEMKPVKKLSYVQAYSEWGWVLGTGIYLDDAESDIVSTILENLKGLKYNNGEGYFWVNDLGEPYPKMLMHPVNLELQGKILDDTVYNTTAGSNQNLFKAMVHKAKNEGNGYVEYKWKQENTTQTTKLGYIRKFEPLQWMIGTGIYIDHIEANVKIKEKEINDRVRQFVLLIIGIGLLLIVGGYFATSYISNFMIKSVLIVKNSLQKLSKGEKIPKIELIRKDEFGEMTTSLNSFLDGINSYTNFAIEIGKGNLDADFKPLSEVDLLGNSLLVMRKNLKEIAESEKIRKWQNEGIAIFNEIIRIHNLDSSELCLQFTKQIVKYLEGSQGALYLLEQSENGEYLDLKSCFAFDRQKYVKHEVISGEGLIGQAFLEKDYIYLTDIPGGYLKIKSGLGETDPTSIIVFPLINNGQAQGVIEIASLKKMELHHFEFLRKVTESLASAITSSKISEKTNVLLKETREMAEIMKAQEEELRQNNEELQATHEELMRKLREAELRKTDEINSED
jgi:signal transduction histidine kinase